MLIFKDKYGQELKYDGKIEYSRKDLIDDIMFLVNQVESDPIMGTSNLINAFERMGFTFVKKISEPYDPKKIY